METTVQPLPLNPSPIRCGQKEISGLLKELPTRKVCQLTHIGWLEGGRQGYQSQEGPLLSASAHPDEWREIAELGGLPYWEISRKDGLPLQLLSRTGLGGWNTLERWGIDNGLLTLETWWWTPTSTDENGEILYCWSKNPEADLDPELETPAKEHKMTVATPPLSEFWNQRGRKPSEETPWKALDAVAAALVDAAPRTLNPNDPLLPDGLFWGELLSPEQLSAPRAGILPHRKIKTEKISEE